MPRLHRQAKAKAFDYFYSNPLLRYFQNWGHITTERFLSGAELIMDLGAGTGEHLNHVKTARDYIAFDIDFDSLSIGREQGRNHVCVQGEAKFLPFASNSFDGIVSVYNLEHLQDLEQCLSEIARILKPAGILSVAIPTEGILFRLGRRFVTAPFAVKEMGFNSIKDYEDFVRQEHINSLDNILAILRRIFSVEKKEWFPFFLGGKLLNIIVGIKAVRH
jgi:ubiquinone/menaquinone biosynthesis C-methylase UbiE